MAALVRGIWAETAPAEALGDPSTWRLLATRGLAVALAVRPSDVERVAAWIDRAREHGVRAAVWPMIDDASGRWLSAANAATFAAFVREVRARAPEAEVVLDLEPPFPLVRGALDRRREAALGLWRMIRDTPERCAGERAIQALCDEVTERGGGLTVGVVPFVLLDGARGAGGGWSLLCGGPWGLPATRVNVMLYTSLLQGYSRGVLGREDARALLAAGSVAAVARFGERASVSLGAAGAGALGDEPTIPDPASLAEDAAIACAAGVRDLWLFDLGGVLARGAPERWLDAFVTASGGGGGGGGGGSVLPRPTVRSRVATGVMWGLGRVLGAAGAGVESPFTPDRARRDRAWP